MDGLRAAPRIRRATESGSLTQIAWLPRAGSITAPFSETMAVVMENVTVALVRDFLR